MIKNFACLIGLLLFLITPMVTAQEQDLQDLDAETAIMLMGASCLLASHLDPKCEQLAQTMGSFWGTEEHIDGIKKYLTNSCHAGVSTSCRLLGAAYAGGSVLIQDRVASELYFSFGCDLQEPVSCFNLGKIYSYGRGVNKNLDKASELFKKSCELGYKLACAFAR